MSEGRGEGSELCHRWEKAWRGGVGCNRGITWPTADGPRMDVGFTSQLEMDEIVAFALLEPFGSEGGMEMGSTPSRRQASKNVEKGATKLKAASRIRRLLQQGTCCPKRKEGEKDRERLGVRACRGCRVRALQRRRAPKGYRRALQLDNRP